MRRRVLITFVALAITALAFLPLCRAQPSLTVYGYTDKTYYTPGDSGTLNLWIYNDGSVDLILKNVSIYYPWYNPVGLWTGNETIIPTETVVIPALGNWSTTSSFTVPNDGRVSSGVNNIIGSSIRIVVVTDKTTETSTIPLTITSGIPYSLVNMDVLVTWLTILVALMVVSALIIAAAIFFSRRSQMTWRQEAKPQ